MRKRKYARPEEKLTDAECHFLKGPVKLVMETCYSAYVKNGVTIIDKIEINSAHDGTNFIETYNRQGAKVHELVYGTPFHEEKVYNEKSLLTETVQYYNGKLYHTTKYIYNEKGQMVESRTTDANGKLSHRHTTTHSDTGQALETVHYMGEEDKVRSRTVYTYLDKIFITNGIKYRKALTITQYQKDGSIEVQTTNTYDEHGNEIESKRLHTDEKKKPYDQHTTHVYNKHNDCIELNYYHSDGTLKQSHTFTHQYDSQGKKIIPTRDTHYDPYALKPGETEQFENDHHGNWIKRTLFYEDVPVNVSVRQINYYDEPPAYPEPFVHPFTLVKPEEVKKVSRSAPPLEVAEAKWLAEGTNTAEAFPMHRYYTLMFKEFPSSISYTSGYIEAFALLKKLEEHLGARIIHSNGNVWSGWRERLTRYTLSFAGYYGYLLQATGINRHEEDEYIVPTYVKKLIAHEDHVYFSSFVLHRPSNASDNRNEHFEDMLEEYISDCTLRRKPEKPFINIVETNQSGFVMKEHPVDDRFEIRDLDVNYGYGFQQFHNDLMQRFNSSTKGLVLFHGQPGTGKTYYIRHLLRKMVANRKVVIYMPPNMVDHLVEPTFMTFLAQEVRNWSAEGNFCVLLIEDAEPLLAKRQEGVRIQGVTNLLNLSDGLLNDMLNLQIICTFNVDLKKLDSALLRPGRLIARKEFKALGELDANLLAQRLGIKHHFKKPATLSEIYAMRKDQNTLIHDVEPDKDASTILDDL